MPVIQLKVCYCLSPRLCGKQFCMLVGIGIEPRSCTAVVRTSNVCTTTAKIGCIKSSLIPIHLHYLKLWLQNNFHPFQSQQISRLSHRFESKLYALWHLVNEFPVAHEDGFLNNKYYNKYSST